MVSVVCGEECVHCSGVVDEVRTHLIRTVWVNRSRCHMAAIFRVLVNADAMIKSDLCRFAYLTALAKMSLSSGVGLGVGR
jgi:uncharacterized Fe-S center protein